MGRCTLTITVLLDSGLLSNYRSLSSTRVHASSDQQIEDANDRTQARTVVVVVRPFQRQHDRFLSRPGRERVRHDALFYAARTAHDANRSGPAHCMHTFVIRHPPGSWYRVSVAALSWCVLEGAFCRTSGFGGGSVQTATPCADLFGNGVQWEISAQRGWWR